MGSGDLGPFSRLFCNAGNAGPWELWQAGAAPVFLVSQTDRIMNNVQWAVAEFDSRTGYISSMKPMRPEKEDCQCQCWSVNWKEQSM